MKTHENITNAILQFDWMTNPGAATAKGIDLYNNKMPPVSLTERQNYISIANDLLAQINEQFLAIPKLQLDEQLDLQLGLQFLTRFLADEKYLNPLVKSPTYYINIIAQGINSLVGKLPDDSEALKQRLKSSVQILEHAKINLQPNLIPSIWINPGLQGAGGLKTMINNTLFPLLRNLNLETDFASLLTDLNHALDSYAHWLKEIESQAQGSFASGPEYFDIMLKDFYLVPMGTQELYEFGVRKVEIYEKALNELAFKLNSSQTWQEQLASLRSDHPVAETLIDSYKDEKEQVKQFVIDRDLVSIPKGEECIMAETPWYLRASTPLGSMNTARAYTPGLLSYFNITPVDLTAPLERQLEHLQDSNFSFIKSIAFHEVIPGHHLQACLHKLQKNEYRKNFYNTILIEGWGLYTEDLMVEEGYLEGVLHLMQLKNALWRAIRVVIDVGLHTGKLTFDEAVALLQEKTGQQAHMARGETLRYTQGPTYPSSYVLGREQILALREKYQQKLGAEYSKKKFHDALLSYGSMPVALIEKLMLMD